MFDFIECDLLSLISCICFEVMKIIQSKLFSHTEKLNTKNVTSNALKYLTAEI